MLFTRLFSVAAILAPFAFVSASPVQTGIVARDIAGAVGAPVLPVARAEVEHAAPLVARGDGGDLILAVLVKLKADVDVQLALLDGKHDPIGPIVKIIALIDASVKVFADIKVALPILDVEIKAIVDIVVYILLGIVVGLGKYGLLVLLTVLVKLDLSLSLWLSALIKLVVDIKVLVAAAVSVKLNLFVTLKLILTLGVLGIVV